MYIKNEEMNEIIIKKSRFISYSFRVNNINEVNQKLNIIRVEHGSATHVCYAYKINQLIKFYDDNEPAGSAGKPILNIIEKHNLNHVLVVIVRYFGGIKLGIGPLTRAYLKSANQVIISSGQEEPTFLYEISFDYQFINEIEKKLLTYQIVNKEINQICHYQLYLHGEEDLKTIKHLITNITCLNNE